MKEIWKDIVGYEGLYQISNLGRVKSLKFGKEKILKSIKNSWGYLMVSLYKDGKVKMITIHRMVAQAFIPNPDNLPQVNHIDENKENNCVDNLEYCTKQYNINFGSRNEKVAKANSKPILQFVKDGEFIRRWDSIIEVERELGFEIGNICMCCKGERKLAYGYKWGYAEDYQRIPFKVFDLEMYIRKKVA